MDKVICVRANYYIVKYLCRSELYITLPPNHLINMDDSIFFLQYINIDSISYLINHYT